MLRTGLVGTSRKENEHRLPVHPRHLPLLPEALRAQLVAEEGYGERFGLRAADLDALGIARAPRRELLADCEAVVLPKPMPEDLRELREGAVLWGWPHCVQQREVTQTAIDRRLTLLAFEAMFRWRGDGTRGMHIFARNNEMAGYCSVLHAFELLGIDGYYGPARRAAVLGFGSVSRGAIYALQGRGISEITVYTQRPPHLVRDRLPSCHHRQMRRVGDATEAVREDGTPQPMADALGEAELVVNGTLQDPERPLMYLRKGQEGRLAPGTLILDVSCDLGMGFPFARPTSFEEPVFAVEGSGIEGSGTAIYHGVDHSPTYLWNAATWEISSSLVPYLGRVMKGPDAWEAEPVLAHAVEIHEGVVVNPKVLTFQGRENEYPHHRVREA